MPRLLGLMYRVLTSITRHLHWLPPLIARISIGAVFAETGWGKLHNLENFTGYLVKLNIPAANLQAPVVAGLEFICGSLIAVGLVTRLASLPLIAIMVVAVLTAKLGDVTSPTDLFSIFEYLFAVMLLWLVIEGPGAVSVDRIAGIETGK